MPGRPDISIVVPLYNEQDCIALLYERIRDECDGLGRSYEIVFVDDGSTDLTLRRAVELRAHDPRLRVASFRRNFGQTAAMAAGIELARGALIVSMDGDLQNDPVDIPRIVAELENGHDVVCGWRKNRHDKFLTRRLPSMIANRIIGWMTGVHVHDNGCSLKGYRATVIKRVRLYGEMHRFIPAMASMAGARITEIVVTHHPRKYGTSKYGLGRIWRVALDIVSIKMIVAFSSRPARWFGLWSIPFVAIGLGCLVWAANSLLGQDPASWLVVTTVAFLLMFLALHLLSLGVIGELTINTGDADPRRIIEPSTPGWIMRTDREAEDD